LASRASYTYSKGLLHGPSLAESRPTRNAPAL
jgi:hypothetical protein